MKKKSRNLLIGLVALGAVAVLVISIAALGFFSPRPTLPTPNGYDDFVKAGLGVTGSVGDYRDLDREALAELVSGNEERLRLLRAGLTKTSCMDVEAALRSPGGLTTELGGMKRLAQLLAAEGRLRELANQPAEAARSYLDAIHLGNEMSRGGLLITRLVGVACEAIGCHGLAQVVPKLSRSDCRSIQTDLERVEATRVSWEEVLKSEKSCLRYHLKTRLNPITLVAGWWNTRQAIERAEVRHKTVIAHERLLATELALRCYQLDTAHVAPSLSELAPQYLDRVPADPFGKGPMVYRPQSANSWLVYSIGPDGIDDGGVPAKRGATIKGDILVDSKW